MNILRNTSLLLLIPIFAAFAAAAVTTDSIPNEYQIEAAYLYKFANYVEWPPSVFSHADAPVIIGIMGADEIAAELGILKETRATTDREVEIKILKPGDSLTGLHMVFISRKENAHLKSLLEPIQVQPVLAITESANALDVGSIINFLFIDEHIRFEVSVTQAERSSLKISARLLGVARKIEARRP